MKPMIRGAGGLFGTPAAQPAPAPAATPVEAPNTLRSRTVADALFIIGEGPIVAAPDIYQAVHLNDVPVKSADGTYNFANVSLGLWLGYPGGGYIPGVPAAEATIAVQ